MGIIRALARSTDREPVEVARRPRGDKERSTVNSPLDPPETVEVDSETVACDGGDGALGHPRVYLNMEGKGEIDCPYCDKRFVLKAGAVGAAAH